jgi:hypothetical protein
MLLLTLLLTLPLAESESESGLTSSLVGVEAMSFSDLDAWREVLYTKQAGHDIMLYTCIVWKSQSTNYPSERGDFTHGHTCSSIDSNIYIFDCLLMVRSLFTFIIPHLRYPIGTNTKRPSTELGFG